jgi:hypothetical protein
MFEQAPDGTSLARHLDALLAQLPAKSPNSWQDIELTAQNLANCLRVKDAAGQFEHSIVFLLSNLSYLSEDNHTVLGNTSLPQTLTSLLKEALNGATVPDDAHASAVFEIFRVAANLCNDHGEIRRNLVRVFSLISLTVDENRGHLLEAGLPQAIVSVLEGYSEEFVPDQSFNRPPFSILHLKVIRTAIGVLLNASIGYGMFHCPPSHIGLLS